MSGGLPRDVRPIAIVVIVGAVMSILDTTIVNVALQTLRVELHAPLSTIQWVATGYLLALAGVIPLTGWAAERFGARSVWMGAVSCFVATSALCGLAWSAESLIAFRVLQGVAGGMIMPVGMITLAQAAGPARMGRVMSVVGVPMLIAPVLGPALGGLLVDHASWRWIFYVNVPVGLVGLVLAYRLLPRGVATGRSGLEHPPLDWRGLLLGSPGVALVVFGVSEYGAKGTLSVLSAWLPLVAGIAMVGVFVWWALRFRYPLVDVRLFSGLGFSAAAGTVCLVGVALFGSMILLPLYYQLARGESATTAGLLLMPQGIGAAIGMNVGGRLTDRHGAGPVVLGGLVVLALGTAVFTQLTPGTPYWLLSAGLFVRGIGLGGAMMPSMAGAYATLRVDQVPRATPMLNVLQRVGGAMGAAVLTVMLQNGISDRLGPGAAGASGFSDTARARAAPALADAFSGTYRVALLLTLAAFIPAGVLAYAERRARPAAPSSAPPLVAAA